MTEKVITSKTSPGIVNLIYTPDLRLWAVNELDWTNGISDKSTPADYAVHAIGTFTFTGTPNDGGTFTVDTVTFTWRTSPSQPHDVAIGSGTEYLNNCSDAIGLHCDANKISVTTVVGSTVVVEAADWGPDGNTIDFSENSSNMTADGSGHLGGTQPGDANWEELESITVEGKGYPVIFTWSDAFTFSSFLNTANDSIAIFYKTELADPTVITTYLTIGLYMSNQTGLTDFGFMSYTPPMIRTLNELEDGKTYTWKAYWNKWRSPYNGSSTISAISNNRLITMQEIKR